MITPFSKIIERHAQERPDHVAYIFMGHERSYKDFNDDINRVANSFIDIGLRPGDKVATILPQSPAFLTVYMAAAAMGLVVVPLDPRFKASEMIALCDRTNPKLLVSMAQPEPIKKNAEELVKTMGLKNVYSYLGKLDLENVKPYESLLQSSEAPVPKEYEASADDPLIIIFTSGTTGKPKGAVISHRNTYAMAKASVDSWEVTYRDRILVNLPTSHVGGTHDLLALQFYAGATGILTPTFNPLEVLDFINKYKISFFGGVPTMYRLIFKNCNPKEFNTTSVRMLAISGEPSPPELVRKIQDNFPTAKLAASWGMSETAGFFTFTLPSDDLETVAGTEGAPAPGFEMKALRFDNTWADPGEVGQLLVKGGSVIQSYMDKEDNKHTFHEGWLKTGDLGFMDENNYLHYIGRTKEMYISGGYNVYPLEVETYLNTYPGINSSCVIEFPDEIWGEVGYAFVVPDEGVELDVEKIRGFCAEGLADYKIPKKILIERDLPRSVVGKIAKQEVRKNMDKYLK